MNPRDSTAFAIGSGKAILRDRLPSDVDSLTRWQTHGEWREYDAPWEGASTTLTGEDRQQIDSVAESLVTEHLVGFFRDRTVIVIAHRLQTVKGADRIVVLENGAIIQEGGFDSLVSVGGRFRQLWEEQTAGRLGEADV